MFSLFFPTETEVPFEGLRHVNSLSVQLNLYKRDLDRAVAYYRNSVRYVSNNHVLVRALSLMLANLQETPEDYYDLAVQRAYAVSKNLQFTTSLQIGEVATGRFYNGSKEIIISSIGYLNPFETNWQEWQPVKVKRHERNHLDYNLPLLKQTATFNDLVVIEVDLPMLSLQYYHYHKQQLRIADGQLLGFGHFVARYVLPNMLYSQADRQLLNRIKFLFNKEQEVKSMFKQPFFTSDFTVSLDRELVKLIDLISNSSKGYETLLKEIPGVTTSFNTALALTDSAPTRQIKWAWYMARKDDVEFIKKFFGNNGVKRNGKHWSDYGIFLSQLKSSNILSSVNLK